MIESLSSNPPQWDQYPCPYCGGEVKYVSNAEIYHGKKFGNGMCYLCTNCSASVGVHGEVEPLKKRPLGILATHEMKMMKMECHRRFDYPWHTGKMRRGTCYKRLANLMKIEPSRCHFGWFNAADLERALKILNTENWWNLPNPKKEVVHE